MIYVLANDAIVPGHWKVGESVFPVADCLWIKLSKSSPFGLCLEYKRGETMPQKVWTMNLRNPIILTSSATEATQSAFFL
jgi:hypothetical protein